MTGSEARLCVKGFRALRSACITLRPVTVLVGPSAGKTSFLEALALIGYGVKHVYEVGSEYSDASRVGPLGRFLRTGGCGSLVSETETWIEVEGRRAGARLACRSGENVVLEYFESERGAGEQVRATVVTGLEGEGSARSKRLAAGGSKRYLAPRFYSYDILAYSNIIKGETGALEPRSYLAEDAANLGTLLSRVPGLLESLNALTTAFTGAEVRVLLSHRVSVFTGYVEVGVAVAATTVLRLAYYYTALRARGPERAVPVLGLDDPEAHMGLPAVTALAEAIAEASRDSYVVLATHSPVLLHRLTRLVDHGRLAVIYLSRGRTATGLPEAKPLEVEPSRIGSVDDAARLLEKGPEAV